jgi:dolichyl-diphosphooligosaccharide--protein glycosyltransferase
MAGLARVFDDRGLDRSLYPVAVVGLVAVGTGAVAVVLPDLFGTIRTNALRFIGFSAGAATRTISEAQPYLSPSTLQRNAMTPTGRILADYGFTLFTGVVAVIWLLAKPLVRDRETETVAYAAGSLALIGLLFVLPGPFRAVADALGVVPELVGVALVALILLGAVIQTNYDGEKLLFVVWAAFITSAAFTQVRFNYYLAPVVAIANAYLIGQILGYLDLELDRSSLSALRDLQGYQVLAVAAAAMLIITPVLLVPMSVRNTGNADFDQSSTAWESAESTDPRAVVEWDGSLEWMEANTPTPGTFGGADNEMEYYGNYALTDDFDYPAGAYGVQSWWDYGHWITLRGQRIPNANPFQQGATGAANYLLAPNESAAQETLGERDTEATGTRYVMVDWQMVNPQSKFGAPVVFYDADDVSSADFYGPVYSGDLRANFQLRSQRYYESLMVRLYAYHGSSMEPQPVVVDWEQQRAQTRSGETVTVRAGPQGNQSLLRQFDNLSAARAYVANDSTSQVGGIGHYPAERVPALEHYRLVKASESSANQSSQYQAAARRTFAATGVPPSAQTVNQPSFVKTFEKVPGATITSTGLPPNTSVRASVPMRVPATNETFTYTQETRTTDDGELRMTLPYSTTGYDEYGPSNGYTNVSVRATGPYVVESSLASQNGTIIQYRSEIQINEGRVNGEVTGEREVTLNRTNPFQNLTLDGGNESASLTPTEPVSETTDDGTGDGSSDATATAPALRADVAVARD